MIAVESYSYFPPVLDVAGGGGGDGGVHFAAIVALCIQSIDGVFGEKINTFQSSTLLHNNSENIMSVEAKNGLTQVLAAGLCAY